MSNVRRTRNWFLFNHEEIFVGFTVSTILKLVINCIGKLIFFFILPNIDIYIVNILAIK